VPAPLSPIASMAPTAESQTKGNKSMGKDDFLKVFVAQMQHQDPSKPMDDTAFMGQMASFSTLEQISNMATSNAQVASNLGQSNAVSLIGRTVGYLDASGAAQTGVVEKVATVGGQATLTVGGRDGVDPSTITQVS
jgi:flagellar basal-body rod modification protein FlgD